MLYLVTPHNDDVRTVISEGQLGVFITPKSGCRQIAGHPWGGDNGAFTGFDEGTFLRMLKGAHAHASTCLFVAVPDVVADWPATLGMYAEWNPIVAGYGYPRAIVIQDGATPAAIPWDDAEAVFIGGSTEWKLSDAAANVVRAAKECGKHVHMGRVNSCRRLMYANSIGCDTADGTFLKYGPDKNLPRLLSWLRKIDDGPQLNLFAKADAWESLLYEDTRRVG